MRIINTEEVIPIISGLFRAACVNIDGDMIKALEKAKAEEQSPIAIEVLDTLLENAAYAKSADIAACQDTGAAIVFLEIGQRVSWEGMPLYTAVNEGVRRGYNEGYLRKSMVNDPLLRVNTNDNTPAIIHTEIVDGDGVKITVLPKGGGSENMSAYKMLNPNAGAEGVIDFVLETITKAGGKPCPPLFIGVGIGGTMDTVTWLSKKALLRGIGVKNPLGHLAALEERLLTEINKTGIGAMGFGGNITAVGVNVLAQGCHITGLPVSVTIQCHAARHGSAVL